MLHLEVIPTLLLIHIQLYYNCISISNTNTNSNAAIVIIMLTLNLITISIRFSISDTLEFSLVNPILRCRSFRIHFFRSFSTNQY